MIKHSSAPLIDRATIGLKKGDSVKLNGVHNYETFIYLAG